MDYDKYKTIYNIDKEKHPDDEIVKIMGRELSLGIVRKVYEKFEERLYTMFIFWDDIIQYTSLGLLDILYEEYNIEDKLPIEDFINRSNDIIYGYEFVINHMSKYKVSKKEINLIFKERYTDILKRSPVTKNGQNILKLRSICDMMYFSFLYKFDDSDFLNSLQKYAPIEHVCGSNSLFRHGLDEENFYINEVSYNIKDSIDIITCQDAGAYIEYIIKQDIHDKIIIAPTIHNGISPPAQLIYLDTDGTAPNECHIHFIAEGI